MKEGGAGHGEDWLVLSKALELRAEKMHGEVYDLGRPNSALEDMMCLEFRRRDRLEERFHQMMETQLGADWEAVKTKFSKQRLEIENFDPFATTGFCMAS